MTKIVYNARGSGVRLSVIGEARYAEIKGWLAYTIPDGFPYWRDPQPQNFARDLDRTDLTLVQVVEELGLSAGVNGYDLRIRELPKGTKYRIDDGIYGEDYESVDTLDETIENYTWSVA